MSDQLQTDSEDTLTVDDVPSSTNIQTPPPVRSGVAHRIIWIFGLTILGNLTLNFLLMAVLVVKYQCQSDQIETIVNKGVIPLLTSTGTFASTLFGPLLAFILGYYFSQKNVRYYYDQHPRRTAGRETHSD
jgi:hypothetical protein